MREVTRSASVALLASGLILGGLTGAVSASSINLNRATLSTGSASVSAVCNTNPLTLGAVRTRYTAPATYEIYRVTVSAVQTACRSKPYALTIADDSSPFTAVGGWTGTTPATNSGNLDGSPGADVDDVPIANQVKVYAVVRTS